MYGMELDYNDIRVALEKVFTDEQGSLDKQEVVDLLEKVLKNEAWLKKIAADRSLMQKILSKKSFKCYQENNVISEFFKTTIYRHEPLLRDDFDFLVNILERNREVLNEDLLDGITESLDSIILQGYGPITRNEHSDSKRHYIMYRATKNDGSMLICEKHFEGSQAGAIMCSIMAPPKGLRMSLLVQTILPEYYYDIIEKQYFKQS
jgi:hypothetical protein